MPLRSLFPAPRAIGFRIHALSLATLLAVACAARAADSPADTLPAPPAPPGAGADAPATAPPLPPPPRPGGGPEPRPPAEAGAPVTTQATVSRFVPNPDGDVEGFVSTEGLLVRFPPHLGADLTATVQPGDPVRISGRTDAAGNLRAERIVDTKTDRAVVDRPPPGAPRVPPVSRSARLSQLSAQGIVAYVTTAPRGEPDGVILANGTVIKLAPPDARRFADLLRTGAEVSAQGYGVRNQYGMALQATAFGAPGKQIRLYDRAAPLP